MTASIVAAELLKVRKRWLPYVLLLAMLAGAAMHVWLAGYGSWVGERSGGEFKFQAQALHSFVLPFALPALLDSGQFWGSLLIGILTASMVATEYSWGTVRQAIARGQTRRQYLLLKLGGIGVISITTLLITLAFGLILAVIATATADRPITFHAQGGPSAAEAIFMIVRAGYCILPYALLAFCLAVVGRSTTLGVAGIALYMILESIVVAVLHGLGGPAPTIRAFTMGHNVAAVLSANNIGSATYNSMGLRETPDSRELPSAWIGAFALAVYCLSFLTISFAIFQKRDMTAGAGAS